ncbi:MAG: hypothetical protein KAJ40_06165 [Alphaproteobacteria bacterium]|nr:hypothetical protein [Alphaproteobacteria bacterium]
MIDALTTLRIKKYFFEIKAKPLDVMTVDSLNSIKGKNSIKDNSLWNKKQFTAHDLKTAFNYLIIQKPNVDDTNPYKGIFDAIQKFNTVHNIFTEELNEQTLEQAAKDLFKGVAKSILMGPANTDGNRLNKQDYLARQAVIAHMATEIAVRNSVDIEAALSEVREEHQCEIHSTGSSHLTL